MVNVGGLAVLDFKDSAAGELDGEVESLVHEKEHRGEKRDQRYDVEDQRMPHEGDGAADLEEFHR